MFIHAFSSAKFDSKSVAFGRGGSSPPTGTIQRKVAFIAAFCRFRCLKILGFSGAYISFPFLLSPLFSLQ
ncbi:hypothetical protein EGL67_22105 [Vibrio parahaemolyticus]|nr:hypothetical protein EGL73_21635 [Vibrio parahaemolyticus]RXP54845.1 hypothetical protein EGL72_21675 [Vibrio parahaemolyticus]RXP67508.1 hypothetical protein EGL70_22565 [Vibrio parahaemolyticus]RXP92332.1 hypothetical protein EGL68_22630 [Vibrio parahaemolyticus]RXQ12952.1 hypothetical protein EGL65_23380 [Vibrio parahaemolyticus]